ncbi:MAG: hypothetical protein U0587_15560 [Candidatus Binatia bacterium]
MKRFTVIVIAALATGCGTARVRVVPDAASLDVASEVHPTTVALHIDDKMAHYNTTATTHPFGAGSGYNTVEVTYDLGAVAEQRSRKFFAAHGLPRGRIA